MARVYHLDRGYERVEEKLSACGARIERIRGARRMTEDARFEDGAERPLRLRAEIAETCAVVAALLQDAVTQTADIAWARRHRRFSLLLNRFRWEDAAAAERQDRPLRAGPRGARRRQRARGRAPAASIPRTATSSSQLLTLAFDPGPDGAGTLRLVLAGDGEIALDVECLDLTLADVTRPYLAQARTAPHHPLD